jgi:hypothetical protein
MSSRPHYSSVNHFVEKESELAIGLPFIDFKFLENGCQEFIVGAGFFFAHAPHQQFDFAVQFMLPAIGGDDEDVFVYDPVGSVWMRFKANHGSGVSVNVHDLLEQLDGFFPGTLEGISTHDAAECAAFGQAANLFQKLVVSFGGSTGEDDNTAAVETALDHVPDSILEGVNGNLFFLIDL